MIFGISKTSINGVLALLITVGLALLASGSPLIGPKATAVITLILAALRAAVGFLQNDAPPPPPNFSSNIPPASKLSVLLLVLLVPTLMLAGCTSWERTTFQTLASAKATIDSAHAAYEASATLPNGSCATVTAGTACIPHTAAANAAITKAVQADTLTVQLMEQYEEDKAAGQSSTALTAASVAVDNALTSLTTITAEVQALYGK